MDHELIGEQLLDQCKGFLEQMLQASDLHRVASASLAIFAQRREGARAGLQAKIPREAQQLTGVAVTPCCPDPPLRSLHPRRVSPQTVFGQVPIRVRPFQCRGGEAAFRADDRHLGVPAVGDCPDAGRGLYAPVVADRPHRVAHDLCQRCPGVGLRSRGAHGLLERTAHDLQRWQAECARQEASAGAGVGGAGHEGSELRVARAMAGVLAHRDGRWQDAKGGTRLGRRLDAQAEEPPLGAILGRRDVGVLGAAEDRAGRLTQGLREAGWEPLPRGEIGGDGAPWLWTVADAHGPGVRQTLAYSHLSEPL